MSALLPSQAGAASPGSDTAPFPAAPFVGQTVDRGGATWTFRGFPEAAAPADAAPDEPRVYTFVYDAEADRTKKARTLAEQLQGTRAYTADGLWEVVAVDASQLPAAAPKSDPGAEAAEEASLPPIPPEEQWPRDGEVVSWEPMTWFGYDCNGSPLSHETHHWDTEDREPANMAFSRPKSMVRLVWFDDSQNETWQCSGVILRDRWVLTAAHCLEEGNEVPHINNDLLYAYKDYHTPNGWGIDIEIFYINPDWSGSNDFDDDFALVKLEDPFTGSPDMDLSNATDATLANVGPNFHNLGYPKWMPICTATDEETIYHTPNNDVTTIHDVRLRWRGDGGKGHSGGPLYYCPDGDISVCDAGEKGFVVAVFAGWNSVYDRFVGPRSRDFYDWAQNLMDNHG